MKPIDLSKIKVVADYPESKYIKEEYEKRIIVLHHTVGRTAMSSIDGWRNSPGQIGTCIVIDRDGTPYQVFSSKYSAWHLKCGNPDIDKHSIGVELANLGYLTLGDGTTMRFGAISVKTVPGRFYDYYGSVANVPTTYFENGYRDHKYFESYTDAQIQTTGELLLYWGKKYSITLDYNPDMWDVSPRALAGAPGIWAHVSYRPKTEKSDIYPMPEMVNMLKTLNTQ